MNGAWISKICDFYMELWKVYARSWWLNQGWRCQFSFLKDHTQQSAGFCIVCELRRAFTFLKDCRKQNKTHTHTHKAKMKRNVQHRLVWPSKPKIFIIWSFRSLLVPFAHSGPCVAKSRLGSFWKILLYVIIIAKGSQLQAVLFKGRGFAFFTSAPLAWCLSPADTVKEKPEQ